MGVPRVVRDGPWFSSVIASRRSVSSGRPNRACVGVMAVTRERTARAPSSRAVVVSGQVDAWSECESGLPPGRTGLFVMGAPPEATGRSIATSAPFDAVERALAPPEIAHGPGGVAPRAVRSGCPRPMLRRGPDPPAGGEGGDPRRRWQAPLAAVRNQSPTMMAGPLRTSAGPCPQAMVTRCVPRMSAILSSIDPIISTCSMTIGCGSRGVVRIMRPAPAISRSSTSGISLNQRRSSEL